MPSPRAFLFDHFPYLIRRDSILVLMEEVGCTRLLLYFVPQVAHGFLTRAPVGKDESAVLFGVNDFAVHVSRFWGLDGREVERWKDDRQPLE